MRNCGYKRFRNLYILPLAALILGALAGHTLHFTGSRDASAALSSLVCVVAVFAVIAWRSRRKARLHPGQQPRIIRIISSTSSLESSRQTC
ncbi:MAG: SoxR reducing system RseC family protein [Thermodesulfobacteriota bacterium]